MLKPAALISAARSPIAKLRASRDSLFTPLANLFFLWVIWRYALGGWETGRNLLTHFGPLGWAALAAVGALVLCRSDYRADVPLFVAGYGLGYWGEWWGTTRGIWTYWNGQTPPDYLPPLWAIGLLTAYHLHLLVTQFAGASPRLSSRLTALKAASFLVLPALAFAHSVSLLRAADWSGRLDLHFYAGIVAGVMLLLYRMDVAETFSLYLCGMVMGGAYEFLGTSMGEWTYITREVPPLWIVPLWGLACVAMLKLARLLPFPWRKH